MEEKGCEECMEWEEHYYGGHVDAKGKLFFRVMVDDFSQYLKIPKKFINFMRGELSEFVNLKDPSGIIWNIELKKTADGHFFQSGWKDFAKAHHLAENDLLLFEYDGNSCFKLKILEGSGCEKAHSYCLKIKDSFKQGMSENSEKILDVTPRHKVNVSSSSSSSHEDTFCGGQNSSPSRISEIQRKPNRHQRTLTKCRKKTSTSNELSIHEKEPRGNNGETIDNGKDGKYRIKQKSYTSHQYENLTEKEDIYISRRLTAEEERRAALLVHKVCSGKPYFISVMRHSYITGTSLNVPLHFRAHLPSQKCRINLRVAGMKKVWRVFYISNRSTTKFSASWKLFVRDNGLLEGDICLFELIKNHSSDREMRVTISRVPS